MAEYRFEVFQSSANNQYYFNFRAPNNEIMAQSEGYVSKSSALSAISMIKAKAANAPVKDLTISTNALRW